MVETTEAVSQRHRGFETWEDAEILASLLESQADAAAAVRVALPAIAAAAELSRTRLADSGRLVYAGAGSSGRIAFQDGVELGPTFGWPEDRLVLLLAGGDGALRHAAEGSEDDIQAAADTASAHRIGPADVVIGVAASGRTPYTVALLRHSRENGALTIAVANTPGPLLDTAECPVLIETGSEVVAGSTRLKAGTAQKIALNLFSTLLMARLGRVHDGRMIDLRVSNAKLRGRALRMVSEFSGCDEAEAAAALATAGDSVKLAVLVARGHSPQDAILLLKRYANHLRPALRAIL